MPHSVDHLPIDDSTVAEKAIACLSGFGFACVTFFFAVLVLVPLTGSLATALALPEAITGALILLEMFGLTIAAGIYGVTVAAGQFIDRRKD